MRIHHLNCGTDCPVGGALWDGVSHGFHGHVVCHCLLIETDSAGLVLVDTGYGLTDVHAPIPRLSLIYKAMLNIHFREQETAVRQVEKLGFSPGDVRHIVLTHLDFDHAGGLEDFPNATIHVTAAELEAATTGRSGFVGTRRYRPMQFDEVRSWKSYSAGGDDWFGFEAVRQLEGLPPEILMIPLRGHSWGHAGVAIQGPQGWLLHAGDAYFYRKEVRRLHRRCSPGFRAYQNLMEVDRASRIENQRRLRLLSLEHASEVQMICAHDVVEFETCASGRHYPWRGLEAAETG